MLGMTRRDKIRNKRIRGTAKGTQAGKKEHFSVIFPYYIMRIS